MYTPQAPVTVSEVDKRTKKAVSGFVREHYGLETTTVEKFDERTASSNVYLATLASGEQLVVKYSFWFENSNGNDVSADVLELAYEVSEALRAEGVVLPEVYKNNHGQYITVSERSIVTVLEYLEGTHFSPSLESFYSAGKGLGTFNKAGVKVLEDEALETRAKELLIVEMPYHESRALYEDGLREELLAPHDCTFPAVCEVFRNEIDLIDATIKTVDESGVLKEDQSSGLLHFDFHVNNGLFSAKGELTGFLDVDQMIIGPHIWDVGNSLVSFISNAYSNDPNCDIEGFTKAFLQGYHAANPLTKAEYERTLAAGIKFDVLRLLRSLRRHRFESDRFSHLYGKIPTRMIPRFRQLPELFTFFTPEWIETEVLQG